MRLSVPSLRALLNSVAAAVLAAVISAPLAAQAPDSAAQNGYYRQPSIRGDVVVFVAEGDLWKVPVNGGDATRLTTHPEQELDPALSPDGEWLAFTATYEGPREVYVMPVAGGSPRRLTYEGGATVRGWTPDGEVLYATRRYSTLPQAHLVKLDPATGDRERIPLADAADATWGDDGALYFTRFFPQSSNTKRYMGGTAQDVWKWIGVGMEAEELTGDWDGTSRTPMWHDGRVYFVTDRDNHKNLWSMAPDGSGKRQHTEHVGWDVLEPSHDGGRVVYQLGGDLRLYDIEADRDRLVPIRLVSDFDQSRERWLTDPMDYLDSWALDEDGNRLGVVAHGRVFVAPVDGGRVFQATRHQGVRYRDVLFRPDTDELLVLSDETGEVEWWRVPETGIGEPEQVTEDGDNVRLGGVASPDGRWVVHWDHDQRLWLTDVRNGRTERIDFSAQWGYVAPVWSDDSRWFVYGKPADNSMMQLYLFDTNAGRAWPITSDRYNSASPTWGPNGDWLYFLSDRNFRSLVGSPWGTRQPEPYFTDEWKAFGLALQPGVDDPFAPPTELDTVNGAGEDEGGEEDGGDVVVEIELAGIQGRLVELPVDPGNYSALDRAGDHLYWISRPLGGEGAELMAAAIGPDPEPEAIAEGIQGYRFSGDRSKMVIRQRGDFHVVAAKGGKVTLDDDSRVDLSDVAFSIIPQEHWRQLFVDSWRLERDYFWDADMSGVDWPAMREKYAPLVDRVRTRAELRDIQAQMAGELATLHTYVYGGFDRDDDLDIDIGFLGARLERAEDAGGWRVVHIYEADPDQPDQASPLDRWGTDVEVGDVLTAINGVDLASVADPQALLRNRVGEQVRLDLVRDGRAVTTVAEAVSAGRDADLRYDEWEYTRRRIVEEQSDSTIGYVHLRAMGGGNIEEWYREYYPVFDRQGLIIDVRHNRGGNIDAWILEKLMRQIWMLWQPRVGDPYWNLHYAPRGHMVVLVDQHTASDGEAFADGFRRLGLGPVIGMRTWGGEIWLTSSNRLVDRGIVTASEFGVYSADGEEWLIEGWGLVPDMVVDNRPHASFRGEDAQLEAALEYLRQQIAEDPREIPGHPPYPDKSVPENAREGGGG
ncbi:MAG: S41 family peptidase [Longimicrobiales bacterium]